MSCVYPKNELQVSRELQYKYIECVIIYDIGLWISEVKNLLLAFERYYLHIWGMYSYILAPTCHDLAM
jgi:hypothetical protein